jgi:beta-phosphoglucomutase
MDGVVINSMHAHAEAWYSSFQQAGYDIERSMFFELEGMRGIETIDQLNTVYRLQLTSEQKEEIYQNKKESFVSVSSLSIYDETIRLIKWLKQNSIPISLVTGSNKHFVKEVLSISGLEFEKVVTGSDVRNGKPHPEPYVTAMNHFPFGCDEWIVVENAPLGIEAAKKAGAYVIALTTTLSKEKLYEADEVIENHIELKDRIAKLFSRQTQMERM